MPRTQPSTFLSDSHASVECVNEHLAYSQFPPSFGSGSVSEGMSETVNSCPFGMSGVFFLGRQRTQEQVSNPIAEQTGPGGVRGSPVIHCLRIGVDNKWL